MLGSLLLTTLPGCAHRAVEVPVEKPVPVAVEIRDTPPAELLRCPEQPAGFPTDAEATMPAGVRSAAIRMARALRDRGDQLVRLIRWHDPEACR